MDQSRIVVGNDGWEHTSTDIVTIHDYTESAEVVKNDFKDKEKAVNGSPSTAYPKPILAQGHRYNNQPIIISEYGGIAFDKDNGWGYGNKVNTNEEFIDRFRAITHAFMNLDYVCGFCYTQLTDVYQEVNGLMNQEHIMKFSAEKINKILSYRNK